jgi:polysaccharide chain length determinant protein (PEP-CTERM system associated)
VGNKRRDTETARRFIDEQIKSFEKKLEEAEAKVKDFKIQNLGFSSNAGQDYFTRMNALSEEVSKLRTELRVAEQSRDALKRELAGEDPVLLPEMGASGAAQSSELDARIANLSRGLDELLRRYTEEHPDVATTRRLIAQLEAQKKQELEAKRKAAAANPARFSGSTNPVFQQLKISLADAEANIAALRTRLSEGESRLAQLKSAAGRSQQIETELSQMNRDYEVLRRNYEQLVARRESASIAGDADTMATMADFRIIEPPRISPKAVFPNRLALVPLVLVLALGLGAAVSLMVSQILPAFYDARQVRAATKRAVLGTVSLQPTPPMIRMRRRGNFAFAGGLASLLTLYGTWIVWAALAARA